MKFKCRFGVFISRGVILSQSEFNKYFSRKYKDGGGGPRSECRFERRRENRTTKRRTFFNLQTLFLDHESHGPDNVIAGPREFDQIFTKSFFLQPGSVTYHNHSSP